jgi:hypothetical protein
MILYGAINRGNLDLVRAIVEAAPEGLDLEMIYWVTNPKNPNHTAIRQYLEPLTQRQKEQRRSKAREARQSAPPKTDMEKLTIPQIKDLLRERNVYFSSKARKPELLELLKQSGGL